MASASSTTTAGPHELGFSELYRSEFAFVVSSLRRLGVAPRDLEDLTHDVFLTAYRRRDSYDPERPIRPWLFGIAYRLASDFRKLVRHDRELPEGAAFATATDDAPAPDESAAVNQQRELVLHVLSRIDLPRRAVFIMHEIECVPIPEIASALQIPLGTAYSRLRQARIDFADLVRALQPRSRS